jgi:hypothetical protein
MSDISGLPAVRGEVRLVRQTVTIICYPNPLHLHREVHHAPVGGSVFDLLCGLGLRRYRDCSVVCWLNDSPLAPDHWDRVRPKAHTRLMVRVVPRGRSLRTVLVGLAVIAASVVGAFVAGPALAGAFGLAQGSLGFAAISAGTAATLSQGPCVTLKALP